MTPMTRKQRIEAMLAEQPDDAFLKYGLALELEKEGDHERSLNLLAELTRQSPPYVAAFLMSAQQLVKLTRISEARTILRSGIEAAREQGNGHAAGEMAELLMGLGAMGE